MKNYQCHLEKFWENKRPAAWRTRLQNCALHTEPFNIYSRPLLGYTTLLSVTESWCSPACFYIQRWGWLSTDKRQKMREKITDHRADLPVPGQCGGSITMLSRWMWFLAAMATTRLTYSHFKTITQHGQGRADQLCSETAFIGIQSFPAHPTTLCRHWPTEGFMWARRWRLRTPFLSGCPSFESQRPVTKQMQGLCRDGFNIRADCPSLWQRTCVVDRSSSYWSPYMFYVLIRIYSVLIFHAERNLWNA